MFTTIRLGLLRSGGASWVQGAPWGPGVHGGEGGAAVGGAAGGGSDPAGVWAQPPRGGAPAEHQDPAAEPAGRRQGEHTLSTQLLLRLVMLLIHSKVPLNIH